MRPSFVVFLFLLSLFLTKAQGIRLEKGFLVAQQNKQHDEEINLFKKNNSGDEEATLCKDKKCTGKIKNRKLVTASSSTTHAFSKNMMNGGEEEEMKVNTLATSKLQALSQEHYSDLVEIAEMDYSPARRKTPIHN